MTHLGPCSHSPIDLVPSETQTVVTGPPTQHQKPTAFLMVASFSPTHDAGGTLHCPSPTNIAHCNHAMQQIRRSLSRSPSRAPLMHVKSHSPSVSTTPHVASPLSPTRHAPTTNIFLLTAPSSPSPLAVPFPPSARVNRPTMRRNGALQSNTPRTRTSPKSPAKRGLSESLDNGNSIPKSPSTGKRQDAPGRRVTPEHTIGQENESTHHILDLTDNSISRFPMSRLEKRRSGGFADFVSMSSPLKRSDGIMNLDQASLGSPAKRRSLHGANFAPDFNIFDHEPTSAQPHHESNSNSEDEDMPNSQTAPMAPPSSPFFSGIPKRSSSLRKSTLQHRQTERQLFHRSGRLDHTADSSTPNSFGAKVRQRLSLDNHVPTPPRDSPFSSQGSLPNASIHAMSQPQFQLPPNPHPLSRTLTQSSSSSSIVDESPTHEPIHRLEGARGTLDFSKSLPVGASRPPHPHFTKESSKISSNGSFSTPESYKFVKPHPAAFMSTGLISKKNRNVEELQNNHGGSKSLMPDTPCKKPMNIFPSAHKPLPDSAIVKKQTRHSFGTPSTPFNPHASGPAPNVYGNGASIFGSTYKPDAPRRASFASVEGDDRLSQSPRPTTRHDSQSSVDFGFPPTPTRPGLSSELGKSHSRLPISPPPIAQPVFTEPNSATKANNSKLNFVATSPGSADGDSDSAMGDSPSGASPSANLRLKSSQTSASIPASFTRSRLLRNLNSPTPLSRKSLAVSSPLISPLAIRARAKPVRLSPASPLSDRFDAASPRTPQENILPPDPSGLSISAHSGRLLSRVYTDGNSSASANVPATPTGPKEYFPQFGRRTLIGFNSVDVDPCLTSRFEKVEIVGVGEFSQVYRVTQPAQPSPFQSFYTRSGSRSPSQKSLPDQVWAVKKSKQAYTGAKDRKRRIHEVDVLKALGHADHIISYIDSWEEKNHLYIQTEFCEEGSLDSFLAHVGTKGRLDDFRIWKILLELSLGLKHIHDSGYIHLDLKPANVLLTFEGVLKIADFGMATKWPAEAGIEGEGDREYIGPEILRGQYDKPADVFALGLIMLEIAGNVELPDNGVSWQKLRNGDMSDVPSLTWSSQESVTFRDSTGNPLSPEKSFDDMYASDSEKEMGEDHSCGIDLCTPEKQLQNKKSSSLSRSGELVEPPTFMTDPTHEDALDVVVRWMISPEPTDRPVADQIMQTVGVHWAELRRRAGATVYEGNWGPADEVLAEDAEMIDV